jgi:hypothetical protein
MKVMLYKTLLAYFDIWTAKRDADCKQYPSDKVLPHIKK